MVYAAVHEGGRAACSISYMYLCTKSYAIRTTQTESSYAMQPTIRATNRFPTICSTMPTLNDRLLPSPSQYDETFPSTHTDAPKLSEYATIPTAPTLLLEFNERSKHIKTHHNTDSCMHLSTHLLQDSATGLTSYYDRLANR